MRMADFAVAAALGATLTLGACVPDVVGIEAVPTGKFGRDLAQCNIDAAAAPISGTLIKRCMNAKGYRFLPRY
jgi:hypothetical protein